MCSDGIARFCRSMLACGMVAEVDPDLRNELNLVLMVVAPPALSLDIEEANKVDRVFKMLSSAVGAGDGLCGYFHKFPVMLEKIRDTLRTLQSNMNNGQRWLSGVSKSESSLRTMMTSRGDFACCVRTVEHTTSEYYQESAFHNMFKDTYPALESAWLQTERDALAHIKSLAEAQVSDICEAIASDNYPDDQQRQDLVVACTLYKGIAIRICACGAVESAAKTLAWANHFASKSFSNVQGTTAAQAKEMAELCEQLAAVAPSKSDNKVWAESVALPAILNHLAEFSKKPRACIDGAAVDCKSFSKALQDALAAGDTDNGVTDDISERMQTCSDKAPLLASGIIRSLHVAVVFVCL